MGKPKIGAGQTVLLTGASSGIGEELAVCFAEGGFDLVLVARSVEKLHALAERLSADYGIRALAAPSDLSRAGSARNLFRFLNRSKRSVDVLVNCAGILQQGSFWDIAPERHQEVIDLNVSGLTAMLAYFVPPMVARGYGRILNVGSVAGFQPLPTLATYAASKAFVLSLSEALAEELKAKGITVTALCPSFTATNLLKADPQSEALVNKLPSVLVADAKSVAAEGYAACIRGDAISVPGTINQAFMIASRATPKWLVRLLAGAIGRKAVEH